MYTRSTDAEFPVFETLSLKFFNFQRRVEMGATNRILLDEVIGAPFFAGLATFPSVTIRLRNGKKAVMPLDGVVWPSVIDRIERSEIVAVGLQTPQDDYHVIHDEVLLSLTEGEPGEEGVNRLLVTLASPTLSRTTATVLADFFQRMVDLFEPSYAFANVHVDTTDSTVLREIYETNLQSRPVDTINVNRYEWDSQRMIKDVCWLNFLSNAHLDRFEGWESVLSPLPIFRRLSAGVMFAISDHPMDIDEVRLTTLRRFFAPLISDRIPSLSVARNVD